MATDVHLCLLLHGLYGSPSNLWCLEEEVERAHNSAGSHLELVVLNATSYSGPKTWDGVDVIAHGVAQEPDRKRREAGRLLECGLIARTLIGQLYARPGFFARHRPAYFSTIATPHLGVLRYGSWRSAWMHAVGQHMFSRTGQQLFCLDSDHGDPFLVVLADPSSGAPITAAVCRGCVDVLSALAQFSRVLFIANGVGDLTVPYCTAAAERHDPFVDYEAGRLGLVVHDHIVRNVFSPQEEDEVDAIVGETLVPAAPTRPWLPPVFYLPYRPVRYILFPLIPILIPVALTFAAAAMAVHSYHSSRRIRALAVHHDHHHRIFGLESSDYDVSGDTPAITRPGSPSLGGSTIRGSVMKELYKMSAGETDDRDTREGTADPCEVCEDAEETGDADGGEGGPILAETGDVDAGQPAGPALVPPSQPILTSQQEAMVTALSALPQLERVVAWFPGVFNAHAVIVARNARIPRWSWQGIGRFVISEWAQKCVSAVQAAAGRPEPDFSTLASEFSREASEAMDVDTPTESRRGSREPTAIEISVSEMRPSPSDSERSHSIA
ncbi:lipid particle protein [Trichosporon asahii var. asahii CBS 2479]|uniref:Lipid particle protein n=1 Tax=Trichosporon asahii var. asahii (strain ATCC 90039 / CBS 2479 / JCM 2466 / KCTC 7840 / NBRC 103889/ NCYC 2677 / UAMH 7654) TaxID=1186058 RepID=J5SLK8_TRIAS|nr:lipid particle protein [Trichosporon asahii var. asahii CBS 2479]EJT46306.1 lipid particle protein [Trichosporon asahii var. asahii CBS 2479]